MTFGPETTTTEVLDGVDLSDKTAVVTGASAGLGVETVRSLASVGAHVVMAVRDPDKGRDAAAAIKNAVPEASLELGTVDLASLDSVRAFAAWLLERHESIDLLINNAGVMACPLGRTAEDLGVHRERYSARFLWAPRYGTSRGRGLGQPVIACSGLLRCARDRRLGSGQHQARRRCSGRP